MFIDDTSAPPAHDDPIRSACSYCGAEIVGTNRICLVHLVVDLDWAEFNRRMCDGLHRGDWPEVPVSGTTLATGRIPTEPNDIDAA